MKKINGFTLIESLIAISIGTVAAAGATKVTTDHMREAEINLVTEDISNTIKGIDLRLNNDGFELSNWSDYASALYKTNNRTQTASFISRAIIAQSASGCGKIDGWNPVKDATDGSEDYKDKYKFIRCHQWDHDIGFELNSRTELINDGSYVNGFNLELFFDNDEDFTENFLEFKKVHQKLRSKLGVSKSGTIDYSLINTKTKAQLTSIQCLDAKKDCTLMVSFAGNDNSQDYLAVNGNNNMIASKVKFQEDIGSPAINSCHRYQLNAGIWTKIDNVACGVGIGLSDPLDINSAKLNYVEMNVTSLSTNKIFLDKICKYEDNTGATVDMPCGVYNDEVQDSVIGIYDETQAERALIGVVNAVQIKAESALVKSRLDVDGDTILNGEMNVHGVSTFNDIVNITGKTTDVNLVVDTSASMKDVLISGKLDVDGYARFKEDLTVDGDLVVKNQIETGSLKITNQISSGNLNQDCSSYGEGTIVYYKDSMFSDLAICSSSLKWKLANIKENQIMAFDGSCPSGFKKFTKADGRVLLGAGSLYDADSGTTLSYNVGDIGGKSKVVMSIDEMPSHSHDFTDAYFSEHWGQEGPRNQPGSNGGQDNDNNLYTRKATTTSKGGNASHENRMPYYVVNWCIYGN